MQRILSFLLLSFLPLAALADGMVIPTVAFPAKVTIPDQSALLCFNNGVERLVIETRFTGSGTNFAWVIPLPSQPVIEEATAGLFPTLQFLFRPQIVHEVPHYFLGILALIWLGYILLFVRPSGRMNRLDVAVCLLVVIGFNFVWLIGFDQSGTEGWLLGLLLGNLLLFVDLVCVMLLVRFWEQFGSLTQAVIIAFLAIQLAASMLPTLGRAKSLGSISSVETVSILDRKLVGIFETTTISSRDPKTLENWLRDNGFAVPSNAEPIIASYITDNWVFVATKIRRDKSDNETSTPHPLSFTFKTGQPVYPMRLTGLDSQSLTVALYVFSNARVTAPHFKIESCTRPNLVHPLLHQWVGDSAVATKLTATLSPAGMHKDIWLEPSPAFFEKKNRLFSRPGALTIALNWGTGLFAASLLAVCLLAFASETHLAKLPRQIGVIAFASIIVAGVVYIVLPKIEVRLVKGGFDSLYWREEQVALGIALGDFHWHTTAEARAGLQAIISNPTNAPGYGLKNWDNYFVGGQVREEDSPGNYLLRETNHQLELVTFNRDGGEEISGTWDLRAQH
jgi:hypothetical protein